MNYLLNKELSLSAKGFVSLVLHLQEAEIKPTIETVIKYSQEYNQIKADDLYVLLRQGYIWFDENNNCYTAYEYNNKSYVS